jgi:hypothetical protein
MDELKLVIIEIMNENKFSINAALLTLKLIEKYIYFYPFFSNDDLCLVTATSIWLSLRIVDKLNYDYTLLLKNLCNNKFDYGDMIKCESYLINIL